MGNRLGKFKLGLGGAGVNEGAGSAGVGLNSSRQTVRLERLEWRETDAG